MISLGLAFRLRLRKLNSCRPMSMKKPCSTASDSTGRLASRHIMWKHDRRPVCKEAMANRELLTGEKRAATLRVYILRLQIVSDSEALLSLVLDLVLFAVTFLKRLLLRLIQYSSGGTVQLEYNFAEITYLGLQGQ